MQIHSTTPTRACIIMAQDDGVDFAGAAPGAVHGAYKTNGERVVIKSPFPCLGNEPELLSTWHQVVPCPSIRRAPRTRFRRSCTSSATPKLGRYWCSCPFPAAKAWAETNFDADIFAVPAGDVNFTAVALKPWLH
ncbi:hypothetical protein CGRA01v4_12963 [Colletotrichum graminicola]|nr:hypothetical protein CGRA01v4_12963 [Colletotrichum graminicola]